MCSFFIYHTIDTELSKVNYHFNVETLYPTARLGPLAPGYVFDLFFKNVPIGVHNTQVKRLRW